MHQTFDTGCCRSHKPGPSLWRILRALIIQDEESTTHNEASTSSSDHSIIIIQIEDMPDDDGYPVRACAATRIMLACCCACFQSNAPLPVLSMREAFVRGQATRQQGHRANGVGRHGAHAVWVNSIRISNKHIVTRRTRATDCDLPAKTESRNKMKPLFYYYVLIQGWRKSK